MMLFTTYSSEAQTNNPSTKTKSEATIEVIQFHSEHRCMTCNKIEVLSREVLRDYPGIPFLLVNVDDEKNEQKAKAFEAYGTALFLFNPQKGKKVNLTEFAFMNVGNKEKFMDELKKEIDAFLKS